MPHRHAISDADWERVKDLPPGRPGRPGWLAADDRRFPDAALGIARTGPLAGLAGAVGELELRLAAVRPVGRKGTRASVSEAPQDPDLEWRIVDPTVIRAHPSAAGARKNGAAAAARGSGPAVAVGAGWAPRSTSP